MKAIHSSFQVNILRAERDPFTIFLVNQAVSTHDLDTDTFKSSVCDMTASVIELTNHLNLRGKPKVLMTVNQRHIRAAMFTYQVEDNEAVNNFLAAR